MLHKFSKYFFCCINIVLFPLLFLMVSTHFADGRFIDTHFADAVSPNPTSPKRRFAEFRFPDKPFPRQAHLPENQLVHLGRLELG